MRDELCIQQTNKVSLDVFISVIISLSLILNIKKYYQTYYFLHIPVYSVRYIIFKMSHPLQYFYDLIIIT